MGRLGERELAVTKPVNLALANRFWAEAIGRTMEVLREIFFGVNLGTDSVLLRAKKEILVRHKLSVTGP